MEPARIDWKKVESRFVEDEIYERINAPKWFDFSAPEEFLDDDAWFCTPNCQHPKAAEDYLRSAPTSKLKHLRSISVSELFMKGDKIHRDTTSLNSFSSKTVKKASKFTPSRMQDQFQGDEENENPNFATTPSRENRYLKSKTEKWGKPFGASPVTSAKADHKPKLKSTLSASNLFAGRFNQITEFCNELKKRVIGAKATDNSKMEKEKTLLQSMRRPLEGSSDESSGDIKENEKERKPLLQVKKEYEAMPSGNRGEKHLWKSYRGLDANEKEKKPLVEVKKENSQSMRRNKGNEKHVIRRINDETENIPLNLRGIGSTEESIIELHSYSHSSQCSSKKPQMPPHPTKTATTLKPSKSMPKERGAFQQVEEKNDRVVSAEKANNRSTFVGGDGEAATRSLDMFCLWKPCTF